VSEAVSGAAMSRAPRPSGGALDTHIVIERHGFRLDAALAVAPGEVVALMGPSGAGKSTLLAAIAGLVRMRSGRVRIDGSDVAGSHPVAPHRRGVVLLGQDPRLFPHLSAADNIAFGMRAHGLSRHAARAEARAWLDRVGLDGFDARRPAELSGGQQQRVALARALATAPRVLLLDEPLTALDPETAGGIRTLLAEQLRAADATALVVTHDALDAASLASRLVMLERGAVTQTGTVREVLTTPATRFAAAVAGTNRLVGVASRGRWTTGSERTPVVLPTDDGPSRRAAAHDGALLAAFVRPADVVLEPSDAPEPRETRPRETSPPRTGEWYARIVRLDHTPGGARVHTADPPVAVDVSADAVAALGLAPGMAVRLQVDAAKVRFAAV